LSLGKRPVGKDDQAWRKTIKPGEKKNKLKEKRSSIVKKAIKSGEKTKTYMYQAWGGKRSCLSVNCPSAISQRHMSLAHKFVIAAK